MEKRKHYLILNTARKLFSKYGLRKTTVAEIAKDARIGKGTIYHYFKSKEDIFSAVVKHESDLLIEKINEAVSIEKKPQDKIRTFILTKIKYLKELINLNEVRKEALEELHDRANIERKSYFEQEIKLLKDILKEGNKKGIFSVKSPGRISMVIISALKELEGRWVIDEEIVDVENSLDILLDIIFKGIEKR